MDNPVVMINVNPPTQAETWYYYYADALGSIRLMTDAGGDVVEGYTYDPFGKPRVMTSAGSDNNWLTEDVTTQSASAIGNPYMFTGRRWYYGIGLYYYRFRDYAPDLGRFLQTDPLGYWDTMNLYQYCLNSPINWIDPWGLRNEDGYTGDFWTDFWNALDNGGWEEIRDGIVERWIPGGHSVSDNTQIAQRELQKSRNTRLDDIEQVANNYRERNKAVTEGIGNSADYVGEIVKETMKKAIGEIPVDETTETIIKTVEAVEAVKKAIEENTDKCEGSE